MYSILIYILFHGPLVLTSHGSARGFFLLAHFFPCHCRIIPDVLAAFNRKQSFRIPSLSACPIDQLNDWLFSDTRLRSDHLQGPGGSLPASPSTPAGQPARCTVAWCCSSGAGLQKVAEGRGSPSRTCRCQCSVVSFLSELSSCRRPQANGSLFQCTQGSRVLFAPETPPEGWTAKHVLRISENSALYIISHQEYLQVSNSCCWNDEQLK